MNEDSARAALLLQAFETAQPPSPSWSDDDRAWATRLALQDNAADAEAFIARRAHHAVQRLGAREPAAAKWLARRLWRGRWVGWAVLAGLIAGGLADSIGSSQRINLLAPPLWAVLAWNAVVYLLLLGHALARLPLPVDARQTFACRQCELAAAFVFQPDTCWRFPPICHFPRQCMHVMRACDACMLNAPEFATEGAAIAIQIIAQLAGMGSLIAGYRLARFRGAGG